MNCHSNSSGCPSEMGDRGWPQRGRLAALVLCAALSACGGLVDKPVRAALFDLGAPPPVAALAPPAAQAPLILADIDASGVLEGTALLYRLAYADAQQLRAYSLARWSAPPPQLLAQRLRSALGQGRVVLGSADAAALAKDSPAPAQVLRLELEEFAHHFESPTASSGRLRVRASLMQSGPAGERLLGQRSFAMAQPATTGDATGGARALAASADALAVELAAWMREHGGR